MSTYIPPIRVDNPHLPFGDQRNTPWYGKDILTVKQLPAPTSNIPLL